MQHPLMGIEIAGYGIAVPENLITNDQLIEMYGLDSSDKKIQELSGMRQRYVVDPSMGETNASLSAESARAALTMEGLESPFDIDCLVVATTTPDQMVPATATTTQYLLNAPGSYAYDLDADCAGFSIELVNSYSRIATGEDKRVIIGTDILSRIVDWRDRRTAILFGDASGAVLLQKTDREEAGLLASTAVTDGSLGDILYCNHGGSIVMEGTEVYKHAVGMLVRLGKTVLEQAELMTDDLKLIVPHQANKRIIDSAAMRLGVANEVMVWAGAGDTYANNSSASIPIALATSIEDGRIQRGDNIMTIGFGAGMTAVASVIRY